MQKIIGVKPITTSNKSLKNPLGKLQYLRWSGFQLGCGNTGL